MGYEQESVYRELHDGRQMSTQDDRAAAQEVNRCVYGGNCPNMGQWQVETPPTPISELERALNTPPRITKFRVCHEHLVRTCVYLAEKAPLTVNPIFGNWS